MADATTQRIMELQSRLRIRLAELGFEGVPASNVVHRLAEIAGLTQDLGETSLPLLVELSPAHLQALADLAGHIKRDLDEIRDAIQDLEPDFTQLLRFLKQKRQELGDRS